MRMLASHSALVAWKCGGLCSPRVFIKMEIEPHSEIFGMIFRLALNEKNQHLIRKRLFVRAQSKRTESGSFPSPIELQCLASQP